MLLNNYFNRKRLGLLLKQDLLINKTKYLLAILGLGFITYLLSYWLLSINKWSLISSEGGRINNYYMTCFTFFMMGVGVIIGTAFPDLKDKIKTANYLLSPGSTLEKFLVQFILRIGLFVPIALGIFWIAIRLAKASLVPELLNEDNYFDPALLPNFEFRLLVTGRMNHLWDTWQIVFMIFGFFSYGMYLFSGPTFFRRFAFIKTTILSGIFFGVCILFMMLLSKIFFPVKTKGFEIQLPDYQITDYLSASQIFILTMVFFSWLFFLCIAYFKLKEKEV